MRVLALSGSLRRGSYNTELLRAAAAAAPPEVDFVLYDGLREVPPYDADQDGGAAAQPAAVERLRDALAHADAVLIATPEYNSSLPGFLKNALDWVSRPLVDSPVRNKPAAVVSSSTSMFGGVWAAAELRKVLGTLGARVLDDTISVPKAAERLAFGVPEEVQAGLRGVLEALAVAVREREHVATAA